MPDYYGGEETEGAPVDAAQGQEQEKDDTGQTALLPKSILAGKEFKPGDEVILKITHIYDDEVEVAYAHEEKAEEPKPKSSMAMAEDRMDRMATPMEG